MSHRRHEKFWSLIIFISIFSMVGLVLLFIVQAASTTTSFEAELAVLNDNAKLEDAIDSASGSQSILFTKSSGSEAGFTFAVVGDIASNSNSEAVLAAIGNSGVDFTAVMGDLGYTGIGNEPTWCAMVMSHLGADHKFEVVVGNHDDATGGSSNGDIKEYIKCLPNKINPIVGDYGVEYYFDYNDLFRMILIAPEIDTYGFSYSKGSSHYNWVSDAIDDAKNNSIPWIALGMHKNCITIGTKSCEIGEDIINLALEKGVNLILQGHEHNYSRSKQWQLSPSCPAIIEDQYDSACVSASGSDFTADNGTILAIVGSGGKELRDIDEGDSEIEYFETWMAKNISPTYGFSEFTVTPTSLSSTFIPVSGDSYTDSFVINK